MATLKSLPSPPDLRVRLLEAAEAEIREGGTEFSLRAVARRIGVSHQAPGYVFTNRAGLFTALAELGWRTLDQCVQKARDAQPPGTSPRHTIAEMGVAYVMFAQERPALFQVMFRNDLVTPKDPSLHAAKRDAFATLFAAVRATVDDGWHPGEPLEQLAILCWSTGHGVAMLHRGGGLDLLVADRPLEHRAREAMRLLFYDGSETSQTTGPAVAGAEPARAAG